MRESNPRITKAVVEKFGTAIMHARSHPVLHIVDGHVAWEGDVHEYLLPNGTVMAWETGDKDGSVEILRFDADSPCAPLSIITQWCLQRGRKKD